MCSLPKIVFVFLTTIDKNLKCSADLEGSKENLVCIYCPIEDWPYLGVNLDSLASAMDSQIQD